tara:strand:- start:159 stop:2465 length:2307 start_codon:yes stop_codon:yes gene_type:complete
MKREIQLYISNTKVDLFKDETISLTDSIKNVRDIAKVFTTFTKSFTLPASPTNNKLFQHYYNFDIINGYDGRIKRDARIEINQAPYKTGKIKLEGVELKSEQPYAYRVTFFGNTVDLKDIFKEDKLKDLSFVEVKESGTTDAPSAVNELKDATKTFTSTVSEGDRAYNVTDGEYATVIAVTATVLTLDADNKFPTGKSYQILLSPFWNSTAVLAKLPLQSGTIKNSLITPLITAARRPIYDATGTLNSETTVNLEYDTNENKGLEYTDLKFALRVHEIIKAIENTYTTPAYATAIEFTTDFFNTSNSNYHNLFLWLSRKSGEVSTTTGAGLYQFFVTGFTGGVAAPGPDPTETGFFALDTGVDLSGTITALQIDITPNSANSSVFTVTISTNGLDVYTVTSSSATSAVSITKSDLGCTSCTGLYRVLISADGLVELDNVVFTVSGSFTYDDSDNEQQTETYTSQTASSGAFESPAIATFDVADQMPDIKVMDFVSGLFKMFNLIAFVNSSGKIEVRTLDNSDTASYYHTNNTTEYDITEYVDIETKQVDVALPYKEIEFKYKGLESFLAENHNQLFNEEWGSLNYNQNTNTYRLDGTTYKIELPFAHFKYERFPTTAVQVGWSANKEQNAFLSKPLLFYPLRQASTTQVSFKGASSPTYESTYNIPSNSRYLSTSSGEDNINFGAMINEYAAVSFNGTLFENYYRNYIVNIFNTKNRLIKIKAKLPLSIVLNYSLNDIFIIKGQKYRINSITTNLSTGMANLELLLAL